MSSRGTHLPSTKASQSIPSLGTRPLDSNDRSARFRTGPRNPAELCKAYHFTCCCLLAMAGLHHDGSLGKNCLLWGISMSAVPHRKRLFVFFDFVRINSPWSSCTLVCRLVTACIFAIVARVYPVAIGCTREVRPVFLQS